MSGEDFIFSDAAERLKRTVREGRSFDAAQVKVIGLDEIRVAAGDHWSRMADRVRVNSLNFLQSRLGPDDLVIPCGDGFLVVYADSDGRDLASECLKVKNALNKFYLGDQLTKSLSAEVSPQHMDSRDMVAAIAAPAAAAGVGAPQIQFTPIWTIAQEVVASYVATPLFYEHGRVRHGYDPLYRATGRNESGDFLALDLNILDRVANATERALATGNRCLIGFCVHSSTLQKRASRQVYREKLASIPRAAHAYLIAKIAEIEPGAPSVTIADWVSMLRTVTNKVMLELHLREQRFEGLDSTRAWAASCFIPMRGPLSVEARARCRALLARWRSALHRQGLQFCVDNIPDPFLLSAACGERVDMASGERFWPLIDTPAGVTPCSRHSLMRIAPRPPEVA